MKLYTYDPAPNPLRLSYFMRYKGVEIDTTQIDLMKIEQLGDEYLAINPHGTVPALILDDGTILTEVIGICAYLEALHPDKPLLGSTALEKAQVLSWDHRLLNTLLLGVAEVLRNGNPNFANRALPGPQPMAQIPELAERGRARLQYGWAEVEAALDNSDWLVGDGLTLADIDLSCCVSFSGWIKSSPPESCKNIHAHTARVREALSLD